MVKVYFTPIIVTLKIRMVGLCHWQPQLRSLNEDLHRAKFLTLAGCVAQLRND